MSSRTPLLDDAPLACVCLAGPTASGKTAVALEIAQTLACDVSVEIISVDSALVYRGMDIGTAKPSPVERGLVPHHLIDILDPVHAYSAANFASDARALISNIRARGRLPLLVGGTMLYFKALFDGLDDMPPADPVLRAALAEQLAREGLPALYAELQHVDHVTAKRLAPADTQRILRALEVFRLTGQPLSSFHQKQHGQTPHPVLISLEPRDRSWLHHRIAQRFTQMLEDGLVDEVRALMTKPGLHAELPSMRCVGYRQAWEALLANDLTPLKDRGIAATRQLAKRQLTWLRGMPNRSIVACDDPQAFRQAVRVAQAAVAQLTR